MRKWIEEDSSNSDNTETVLGLLQLGVGMATVGHGWSWSVLIGHRPFDRPTAV